MSPLFEKSIRTLRSVTVPALAGLLALGLAACGDDGPTGPDVSQEQAEAVASAVTSGAGQAFNVVFSSATSGTTAKLGTIDVPAAGLPTGLTTAGPSSFTFDQSSSCPEGGSLSTSGDGTVNSTQNSFDMSWNAEVSYSDCGVTDDVLESGGNIFILSTSSPLQFSGDVNLSSDNNNNLSGTFTWNYSGSVDWDEQGGPSNTCDMDLNTTVDITSFSPTEASVEVRGTTCGRDINQVFQVTSSS